jgi:hypothetical protein
MDPITLSLLIGAGVQILGGVAGEAFSAQDRETQQRLLQQATDAYGKVNLPKLQQLVGEQVGPSELSKVGGDPELQQAQRGALDEIMRVARSGGMTLEDKANLNRVQNKVARTESAGRNRISEDMAARGISGGGAELAMQLANNQQASQQASENGLETAAAAQHRALDAMMQGGRLAGDIRGQDYNEKARAAEAQDMINRYNADSRSRAAQYNAGLAQQQYENEMRQAQGKAGGLREQSAAAGQRAQDTRSLWNGLGTAGSRTAGAAGRGAGGQQSGQSPYPDSTARRAAATPTTTSTGRTPTEASDGWLRQTSDRR